MKLNWNELNWNELNWNQFNWNELNWNELNWNEIILELPFSCFFLKALLYLKITQCIKTSTNISKLFKH